MSLIIRAVRSRDRGYLRHQERRIITNRLRLAKVLGVVSDRWGRYAKTSLFGPDLPKNLRRRCKGRRGLPMRDRRALCSLTAAEGEGRGRV